MTILVTGSTGKTSKRVAQLLQDANIPFLLATRRQPSEVPFPSTKFDWFDNTTFANPFNQASDISAIYLVAPETQEPAPHMNEFIDFAIARGVKKFVLLAGSSATFKGGPYVGKVWAHLDDAGTQHAILRPTWFNENFSEMQHRQTIKEESVFYTAAEDGKVPFVSADDIAASAFAFLSGKVPYGNKDYLILGPDLLTHDQVAEVFTAVLGRPIKHVRKSQEEMVAQYLKVGLNPLFAHFLPLLETRVRDGNEEGFTNDAEDLIGRKVIGFKDWVEREAKQGIWG